MHQALNVSSGECLEISRFESPLGSGVVGFVGDELAWLGFGRGEGGEVDWPFGPVREVPGRDLRWLLGVCSGQTEPSLRPKLTLRGTAFQLKVWHALLQIPRGETRSYGKVAEMIGHPRASRAVGSAVGANRIALLVPCHRVIRADGQLGAFRWGAELKRRILEAESRV